MSRDDKIAEFIRRNFQGSPGSASTSSTNNAVNNVNVMQGFTQGSSQSMSPTNQVYLHSPPLQQQTQSPQYILQPQPQNHHHAPQPAIQNPSQNIPQPLPSQRSTLGTQQCNVVSNPVAFSPHQVAPLQPAYQMMPDGSLGMLSPQYVPQGWQPGYPAPMVGSYMSTPQYVTLQPGEFPVPHQQVEWVNAPQGHSLSPEGYPQVERQFSVQNNNGRGTFVGTVGASSGVFYGGNTVSAANFVGTVCAHNGVAGTHTGVIGTVNSHSSVMGTVGAHNGLVGTVAAHSSIVGTVSNSSGVVHGVGTVPAANNTSGTTHREVHSVPSTGNGNVPIPRNQSGTVPAAAAGAERTSNVGGVRENVGGARENVGGARRNVDESLRVNPDLHRTISSIPNNSIYEQGFWNQPNRPQVSANTSENNKNTSDDGSTTKKEEAPLQLEDISGELRQYVDNTTCAICTDLFEDPRILPCGHTFCFRCILAYMRAQREESGGNVRAVSQKVTCPVCRSGSTLQVNEMNKLTKNFTVKSLVETVRVSAKKEAKENNLKKTNSNALAAQSAKTVTRLKDLQKHTVMMGRKFKVSQRITGVLQMGRKIYVTTEASKKLLIYEKNQKKADSEIDMQGVSQPKDIAGNEKLDFVFVVDAGSASICRVFVSGPKKNDINVFLPGISEPFNISLSPATMLLSKLDRKNNTLCTYQANPTLLKCVQKITLPRQLNKCLHAIQTPTGDFYISHSIPEEGKGCAVSKIDKDGNVLRTLSSDFILEGPLYYLSFTADGDIVASEGCLKCLLRFDSQLNSVKVIWKLKEGFSPWKIHHQNNQLAVAYESEYIQTFEI